MKKIKFAYYNDETYGVALSINDLHSTSLVLPKSMFMGEVEIDEDDILFIKKWNKMVLISKMKESKNEET
jgi:hypothetical protein